MLLAVLGEPGGMVGRRCPGCPLALGGTPRLGGPGKATTMQGESPLITPKETTHFNYIFKTKWIDVPPAKFGSGAHSLCYPERASPRPRTEFAVLVHCSECQTEFPPGCDRCPTCGSDNVMVGASTPGGTRISVARPDPSSLTAGATVFRLYGKGDSSYKEGGRFLRHNIKIEWSSQRQQLEYVERVFDKVQGTYIERCYDPKTGAMTFEKQGRITDQSLHGRRGRPT